MNKSFLIPLGVVAFAVTLAVVLRDSLSGEAQIVALGIAIGLILGVPAGMLSMSLAGRASRASQQNLTPMSLSLTPEQTELLLKAIERQQASPANFGLAARQPRTFSAVGGADVADLANDADDQH